jgi:hypothetical protein
MRWALILSFFSMVGCGGGDPAPTASSAEQGGGWMVLEGTATPWGLTVNGQPQRFHAEGRGDVYADPPTSETRWVFSGP